MRLVVKLLLVVVVFATSCTHTIYVVRHAEKVASNDSDPSLTELGRVRADALKDTLRGKNIKVIYSTNTNRTRSTAAPTAFLFKDSIRTYGLRPDSMFYNSLLQSKKNTLVIGHSNTIDDIVNGVMGKKVVPGDFKDWEYDNLFIIRVRGKKKTFVAKKYGPRIINN